MDIRFVDTLLLAIEEGSLAASARRQGITAAAASQRIAAMEAQLGVPLLVRDGRRMAATPDCEALLPDFRQMVALRAGLEGRLAQGRLSGPLRLGAVSTALSDFGPALVQHLGREAPQVALGLRPGGSPWVFEQFESGQVDAALLVAPPFDLPKTMQFDQLARQDIGLLRAETTPKDAPFLVYERAAWGGAQCWAALKAYQPEPPVLCEMDAVEILAQMVADGLGQAVLPRWGGVARHHPDLAFQALPDVFRDVGLLTWRREARRPVIALLRKVLLRAASQAQRS